MNKRVSRRLELFRSGIADAGEQDRIIAHEIWIQRLREILEATRATDHGAYVEIRARTSVFDLIEAGGDPMIDALTKRGTFRRGEVICYALKPSASEAES